MADGASLDGAPGQTGPRDVDPLLFRQVMGRYATGVSVVTTVYGGMDHAMTANSLTSVSLSPPLVLVCVETDSRFDEAIVGAGFWGVSLMAERGRPRASWLATKGRPLEGQLATVPHHAGPATGSPLLAEAVATFECRTFAVHEAGDHHIVIGEVLALDLDEECRQPLIYWASSYHTLGPNFDR